MARVPSGPSQAISLETKAEKGHQFQQSALETKRMERDALHHFLETATYLASFLHS